MVGQVIVGQGAGKRKSAPKLPPAPRRIEADDSAGEVEFENQPAEEIESEQTAGCGAEREVVRGNHEVGANAVECSNSRHPDERRAGDAGGTPHARVTDRP